MQTSGLRQNGKNPDGYIELNFTTDKQTGHEVNAGILLDSVNRLVKNGYPKSRICVLVRYNADAEAAAKVLADAGYQVASIEAFKLGASECRFLNLCRSWRRLDNGDFSDDNGKIRKTSAVHSVRNDNQGEAVATAERGFALFAIFSGCGSGVFRQKKVTTVPHS